MKIGGTTKIIEAKKVKEEQENIVYTAETQDLLHDSTPKGKFKKNIAKVKKIAFDAIDKAKPIIDKAKPIVERQKQLTSTAISKAREISPYFDKSIITIDKAINYITKPEDANRSDVVQDTRAPAVFGIWVLILTFGIGMMWSILAPLDSASHARGRIILDSKKRLIQSPEGGIVKEVYVRDGDHVEKGQTLLVFEDTEIKAAKLQAQHRAYAYLAEINRLTSERDGKDSVIFDQVLLDNRSDLEVDKILDNQERLFKASHDAYSSKLELYTKKIHQSQEQKKAYEHILEASVKTSSITKDQVERFKKLYDKGNLSRIQLQEAEARNAESQAKKGQLESAIAEANHAIIASQLDLENFKNSYFHDLSDRIRTVQNEYAIINEEFKKNSERLERTVVKAPETGDIANLYYGVSPKSVVFPQQVLLEVIPQDDKMVVEVKIPAQDISVVKLDQLTRVRLTAYRARIVPLLDGKLISISADITIPDQRDYSTGVNFPYYKGRIEIDKDSFAKVAKLNDVKLFPGMDVDVQIVTGTRTLMRYLLDPITMTMNRAFREK